MYDMEEYRNEEDYMRFLSMFEKTIGYLHDNITPENAAEFGVGDDFPEYLSTSNYAIQYKTRQRVVSVEDREDRAQRVFDHPYEHKFLKKQKNQTLAKEALHIIARHYFENSKRAEKRNIESTDMMWKGAATYLVSGMVIYKEALSYLPVQPENILYGFIGSVALASAYYFVNANNIQKSLSHKDMIRSSDRFADLAMPYFSNQDMFIAMRKDAEEQDWPDELQHAKAKSLTGLFPGLDERFEWSRKNTEDGVNLHKKYAIKPFRAEYT
ncbi:MAG TPA: hypothetical protein VGF14_04575 [Alphaproteobacteria bacterium]